VHFQTSAGTQRRSNEGQSKWATRLGLRGRDTE
jgi:hypothetical protein